MEKSNHNLITEEARHRLLVAWNQTTREYPRGVTFHALFEAQAKRTPDSVAVVFGDTCLTYRELNGRTNQLAHYLQGIGVCPEMLVGLYLERGLDLLLGILGTLKAGGAYLPLDPGYPSERIRFMLGDARPPFLITQSGLLECLPEYQGDVLCIDSDWTVIAGETEENPEAGITVNNLAYVIYTSGTTGQPKGTLLEHRGLSNVSAEQIRHFNVGPGSRVLQFSSPNFDASLFDIVMALTSGATLVLARQEELLPGPGLIELLRAQAITVLTVPPSVLNVLPSSLLPDLQVINVAGEACAADLVSRWAPGRRFFNLYGPTECTIWSTIAECHADDSPPTIGRPIGNTRVYILDEELQLVPVGVPGELFIGGIGIARGYLKREELTSEKFLADPYSTVPGERMYRTGDRVRYLVDGNIEFLGRVDEQVKIRGFRVEPAEIETTLRSNQAVRDAVVRAHNTDKGDYRMVAYLVLEQDAQPTTNDLRSFVKDRLPEYMMPSVFMIIDALPLTPNGKLDRQALPAPDWNHATAVYVPPRDLVEKLLADVYTEVLDVEKVGVQDNFYELGGHSLNITQLIARIRDTFHVEIPFRSVFDNPKLSMLAADIKERMRDGSSSEPFYIEPIKPGESLPLSYSQERVWFIRQLDESSRAYNAQAAIHWYGQLDIAALEQGLSEMVRRHEILRTSFIEENGTPVQFIHEAEPVKLRIVNIDSSAAAREIEINALVHKTFAESFDVTRLPLVRWTLIRLGESEFIMTLVEHHLIHDGWSFNVFLDELLKLYKAYHQGRPSPLTEPELQFSDIARWQRHWMQGEEARAQLAYWEERLAGCEPLLQLPYDRPRPAVQSFRGAAPRLELPVGLCERIEHLCREAVVTPFMTFLTGLLILLHRYSQQDDICVGTGMANRRWRETEGLLGMIINNVVLRTDISADPRVLTLLRRVRECTLDASAHQDLPFEKVVEALRPERSLSFNPLFQVMFGMHDSPMSQEELPGLTGIMDVALENRGAKFDLTVVIVPASAQRVSGPPNPGPESWTVIWEYNTDLFDEEAMSSMLGHYQAVLEGMVEKSEQRVSEIAILSEQEQRQLLVDWNATTTDFPHDITVSELFEAQAASSPTAVALRYDGQMLSYGELNERANRLAHYLRLNGIGPEVMVGICVERSLEMVVGLLGILKAGGAYVPLDSDYPKPRLAFMLEDAQMPVLLTLSTLISQLPDFNGKVICLDTDWPDIEQASAENPSPTTAADNLAYVIYTSGSTGTPKGVAVPHRAINRLVCETDYFQVTPGDRVAQASNVSFDAATFEVWGALLNGGQLVGVSKDVLLNPQTLSAFLSEQRITALFVTTALFNLMAREAPQAFSGLRGLMFGGEAVDPQAVRQVMASGPPERLLHVYGPTECTTFATWYKVEDVAADAVTVPIGRPLANTSLYVLDKNMNPVPVGVAGELYIGGDGVARGYLKRPELTAERFVADPFSADPQARLYRTGDRVRYRRDGAIEFQGRFDHQVKLRGFRIELGEVEAMLGRQPGVETAIVLLREDEPGDKRLVAYVLRGQGQTPGIDELRDRMQEILPAYMVPSVIVPLDAMPLTPNGKVDREALPQPDKSALQSEAVFVEPSSNSEQRVAEIWQDLLSLGRIGIHDNFFHLGGHSLLATQVINRLKEDFGLEVPLAVIFESPSVAELANYLDAAMWAARTVVSTPEHADGKCESGEI